jgi:hypothetical protein
LLQHERLYTRPLQRVAHREVVAFLIYLEVGVGIRRRLRPKADVSLTHSRFQHFGGNAVGSRVHVNPQSCKARATPVNKYRRANIDPTGIVDVAYKPPGISARNDPLRCCRSTIEPMSAKLSVAFSPGGARPNWRHACFASIRSHRMSRRPTAPGRCLQALAATQSTRSKKLVHRLTRASGTIALLRPTLSPRGPGWGIRSWIRVVPSLVFVVR